MALLLQKSQKQQINMDSYGEKRLGGSVIKRNEKKWCHLTAHRLLSGNHGCGNRRKRRSWKLRKEEEWRQGNPNPDLPRLYKSKLLKPWVESIEGVLQCRVYLTLDLHLMVRRCLKIHCGKIQGSKVWNIKNIRENLKYTIKMYKFNHSSTQLYLSHFIS